MKNSQILWKATVLVFFTLYINQTWSAYLPVAEEDNNENRLEGIQKQKYLKHNYNHKPEYRRDNGNVNAGEAIRAEDYNYNDAEALSVSYTDENTDTIQTAALGNWRSLPHGSYDKNNDVVTGNAPTNGRMIWPDQSSIFNAYENSDAYDGFDGDSDSDSDSNIEMHDDEDEESTSGGHTLSRKRRGFDDWFIAPHTRWCGRGNIANNTYNQLGGAADADRCCRRHDHCPLFISAFSSRFELFNYRPYTLSHCNCDRRFRTCLKMNNDDASNTIGQLFFNMLPTQCFILRNERKCVERDRQGNCLNETSHKRAYVRDNLKY